MTKPLQDYCPRHSCQDCSLRNELTCSQTWREVLDFMSLAVLYGTAFFGGMIQGEHWIGLTIWCALAAVFFLYGQQFLICRHCPHYAAPAKFLKCHAAFGLPKFPKYDPRPLTAGERAGLAAISVLLFLYYVPFFALAGQWFLLALTSWALFTWIWCVQRFLCSRCVNLHCPFNRLPLGLKREFSAVTASISSPRPSDSGGTERRPSRSHGECEVTE